MTDKEVNVVKCWIEHQFPLRDNFTARLLLPRDLTMAEVRRITRMLETLVRR